MVDNQCLSHGIELYGVLYCPVPACDLAFEEQRSSASKPIRLQIVQESRSTIVRRSQARRALGTGASGRRFLSVEELADEPVELLGGLVGG